MRPPAIRHAEVNAEIDRVLALVECSEADLRDALVASSLATDMETLSTLAQSAEEHRLAADKARMPLDGLLALRGRIETELRVEAEAARQAKMLEAAALLPALHAECIAAWEAAAEKTAEMVRTRVAAGLTPRPTLGSPARKGLGGILQAHGLPTDFAPGNADPGFELS
jgi:hypothetical protein